MSDFYERSAAMEFLSLDVASTLTGVNMRQGYGFDHALQIASQLLGYPVFLHELVHGPTQDAYCEAGYRQFPDMPRRHQVQQDWQAAAVQVLGSYGTRVMVMPGNAQRQESPEETLRTVAGPDKPIVTIVLGDDD